MQVAIIQTEAADFAKMSISVILKTMTVLLFQGY
jgi:hypothetical protein